MTNDDLLWQTFEKLNSVMADNWICRLYRSRLYDIFIYPVIVEDGGINRKPHRNYNVFEYKLLIEVKNKYLSLKPIISHHYLIKRDLRIVSLSGEEIFMENENASQASRVDCCFLSPTAEQVTKSHFRTRIFPSDHAPKRATNWAIVLAFGST